MKACLGVNDPPLFGLAFLCIYWLVPGIDYASANYCKTQNTIDRQICISSKPYLTLPYLTLPCLTLRYLTLRYRTLPYPTTMLSVVDRVFWGLNMLPILILMAFNLTLDSLWDKLLGNRVNLLLQFSAAVMGLFV